MNARDIEKAVVWLFGYRKYLIVANASWGVNIHECDLLLVNSSDYGVEVEIKVSKSDIIADQKKKHHRFHGNPKIKRLYFAIPEKLATPEILALIPEHAGVISVWPAYTGAGAPTGTNRATIIRKDKPNKAARPWTLSEKYELARLGAMRCWYRQPLFTEELA